MLVVRWSIKILKKLIKYSKKLNCPKNADKFLANTSINFNGLLITLNNVWDKKIGHGEKVFQLDKW